MQEVAARRECAALERDLIGVEAGHAAEAHDVSRATKLFQFAVADEAAVKARAGRIGHPVEFVECLQPRKYVIDRHPASERFDPVRGFHQGARRTRRPAGRCLDSATSSRAA